MEFDLVQPIRFFITIMKYLGLWRLDNRWQPIYRTYSYALHFFFTFLLILSMWASVFTAKDIEKFTESSYMALTEAALLAKVINMLRLSKDALRFFELVESKDASLKNSEEINIFKTAHRSFYFVGIFYITACVGVIIVAFAAVMFRQEWILPYPAWMPFDLQSKYYWYAYGYQFIGMMLTCLANVCLDIIQCYFLHHLSLIYRVIGYRLENVGIDAGNSLDENRVNNEVFTELVEIIKLHDLAKRITANCEGFMSFPIFMQILLSALVLCFTGYQIQGISPLGNPGQFIGMVDFLLVMGLQIFLPCYYANQVTIQSDELCHSLYNSNWIILPKKSKKLIYLYMIFLKKPVHVKAGKFFNIGLPIFSKTINNAYSYFAVLIRMKN